VSRVQQQAPLGTLALGAEGIALLRRQESEITIASAN
jgi:hypothetical protein